MELLLIRHGIAADKREFKRRGIPDEARPLTQEGREGVYAVALGLATLIAGLDVLAASPLLRAKETADIIDERFSAAQREMTQSLRPDQPFEAFLGWLRTKKVERVAAVGHEPHLSELISYLVSSGSTEFDELDKGGIALLRFEREIADGAAEVLWIKTPEELAALG
ncbi:MAG TPA: phosphohistidine phosphatase SixA [Longimicrobiales bacterium]|nr:phosphohistidine phosphatase SixA [Longimicrobiales bacterium]